MAVGVGLKRKGAMIIQGKAKRSKHEAEEEEGKEKRKKLKEVNGNGCCTARGARYRRRTGD
jgi:hypothetical protein